MKIAVTGASGFIGRNLVLFLAKCGHEVISISRQSIQWDNPFVKTCLISNYENIGELETAFHGVEVVVHLAGVAHVFQKPNGPRQLSAFTYGNVICLVCCVQAARKSGCKRFVYVSSIGVNGESTNGQPFTIHSKPCPSTLYSFSKYHGEIAIRAMLEESSMDFVIIRPPMVYGDNCPGYFRRLVGIVRLMPVLPFAGFVNLRSFVGVDNLCSALEVASSHPACRNRLFLISDGEDISFSDLTLILARGIRRSAIQVPFPKLIARILLSISGQSRLFFKANGELLVDSSFFAASTGWRPPRSLVDGLLQASKSFSKKLGNL